MGKHENSYERVPRDGYQTRQEYVVRSFAEHVGVEGLYLWEFMAGEGFMARNLRASGARVFTSDIEPHPDLDAVWDFFSPGLPPGLQSFDGMVSNSAWGERNT